MLHYITKCYMLLQKNMQYLYITFEHITLYSIMLHNIISSYRNYFSQLISQIFRTFYFLNIFNSRNIEYHII